MSATITDPLFGVLNWDWLWQGKVVVPWLGGPCDLYVDNKDEAVAPNHEQRAAFEWLRDMPSGTIAATADALLKYYEQVRPIYLETPYLIRDGIDRGMPVLTEASGIWPLLFAPTVTLPAPQVGHPTRISVAWSCTWDDEHGVEVFYEQQRPVHVDISGPWAEWEYPSE